jgi:hypothetical protein
VADLGLARWLIFWLRIVAALVAAMTKPPSQTSGTIDTPVTRQQLRTPIVRTSYILHQNRPSLSYLLMPFPLATVRPESFETPVELLRKNG